MEYNDLPPFEAPDGSPATSAIAPPQLPEFDDNAVVDDDDELDDEPIDGDDEPDDDDTPESDDESGGTDASTDADLKAQLKEAQEQLQAWNQFQQEQEQLRLQQEQAAAEKYWDDALAEANSHFARQEAQIYREAEAIAQKYGSDEAELFARNKNRELFASYQGYLADFHSKREAGIWQIVMKAALPGYAADVAKHYGLNQDAVAQLLQYPHELMPREAERMKREKDSRSAERRKATQLARRAKNLEVGNRIVTPGSGRAVSPDVELGSSDHYNSIPWERVKR